MQKIQSSDKPVARVYLVPFMLALGIHLIFILFLARIAPDSMRTVKNKNQVPIKAILRINLNKPRPATRPAPVISEPDKKEPAPVETLKKPVATKPETVTAPNPMASNDQEPQKRPQLISTAKLRSQLLHISKNSTMPLKLGSYRPSSLPPNWTHKALEYTPGPFKAAELPTKAIVLDKWKAADGTQNNKIKLPNGDIVCGSLAPQNPIDIYSMPIWMYHSC